MIEAFDLIAHIAFDQPPLSRRERANNVRKRNYFGKYGKEARAVLEALLDKYADHGITDIISSLFYSPEVISSYFGDGSAFDVTMSYFRADADYGTAGSVRLATEGINERILVISGDVLTDFNLTEAIGYHEERKPAPRSSSPTPRTPCSSA